MRELLLIVTKLLSCVILVAILALKILMPTVKLAIKSVFGFLYPTLHITLAAIRLDGPSFSKATAEVGIQAAMVAICFWQADRYSKKHPSDDLHGRFGKTAVALIVSFAMWNMFFTAPGFEKMKICV